MNKKVIGNRMKNKRKKLKLTQKRVSKASGISLNYYSSIENGRNSPSLELLMRISEVLDTSLVYLLNDKIEDTEKRVDEEAERLLFLFKEIPKNQKELAHGLIIQAARLRILLDDNWKDILENGEYEKFKQSDSQIPFDRKRPIVESYDNRDKTYQAIIKQLTELLPRAKPSKKNKLLGK